MKCLRTLKWNGKRNKSVAAEWMERFTDIIKVTIEASQQGKETTPRGRNEEHIETTVVIRELNEEDNSSDSEEEEQVNIEKRETKSNQFEIEKKALAEAEERLNKMKNRREQDQAQR